MTDGQRGCGRHAGEASDFSAPVAVADGRGGAPQESCGFCSEGLTGQNRATRPLTSLATAWEQLEKTISYRYWSEWTAAARLAQRFSVSPAKPCGKSANATGFRRREKRRRMGADDLLCSCNARSRNVLTWVNGASQEIDCEVIGG